LLKVEVVVMEVPEVLHNLVAVVVEVLIIIREELVIEGMVQINHHQLLSLHKEIVVDRDILTVLLMVLVVAVVVPVVLVLVLDQAIQ
tara:strand:- start:434 stop:694 length:261 start_codon:yes stop_codon:yes gene_type:complete